MHKIAFTMIIYITVSFSISADDMIKKTGELVSNIKATVLRGGVSVEYEDGKILQFTKKVIKSIKFKPVLWKPKVVEKGKSPEELAAEKLKEEEAEKSRLAEATKNGDEWKARPEEEQINPWGNFALGLIPGYSGLYRTGVYFWTEIIPIVRVKIPKPIGK